MKIAVVSEFFYPHSGGQEQRLLEILESVAKQGHKVDVYTIKYDEDLSDQENYNEINILRVIKNKNYIGGGGLKSRSLKTIIQYSLKVASRLGANSYDKVIFSQFPIFHMLLTCFTKSKKILDFVEYRHGRFWEFLFGLEMKCADQVVCISDVVKEKALKICDGKKLLVIPSSIKLKKFYSGEPKHFIFIGRMEQHKHPEMAIETVLQYNAEHNQKYVLHLIGDGSMLEFLRKKYNYKNIIFHGFVTEEKKIRLLADSIALIFPSEREGLPVSVIEAMAADVPTLTTRYANNGTYYFVNDKGVGVVAEPDIISLTAALHELLENRIQYVDMCKLHKKNFSAESAARKFIEI